MDLSLGIWYDTCDGHYHGSDECGLHVGGTGSHNAESKINDCQAESKLKSSLSET